MEKYRRSGIKIVGEVVNAHPVLQNRLLSKEYAAHGLAYHSGEKFFEARIIKEYKLCDYLLVPSQFLKQSLIDQGFDPNRIKVIPYGLNKSAKSVKDIAPIAPNTTIKLLCVAQLTFRKGIIYLLKAIEFLHEQGHDCRLTLIGAMDKAYKPVIVPYLASSWLTHTHHVDNSAMEEMMIQHDLFVMPSLEDGFGIVVSEALSVQLPVIVTTNCGASEVVTEGKNGFVVEPFSDQAIADGIIRSIGYRFEFPDTSLSWKDYAVALDSTYQSIIK